MRKKWMAGLLAASLALTGACGMNGSGKEKTADGSGQEAAGGQQNAGTAGAENRGDAEGGAAQPGSSAEGGAAQSGRSLMADELAVFTEYVSEADNYGNYGFLLSVYDTPAKIDLTELFYCGAGMKTEPLDGPQKAAYLAALGRDEIYTDVTCLTTAQMDEFLLKKTGMTYAQMERPLEWTYLKEYDLYCMEHGDTNYVAFTCVSGSTADEKTFTLRFRVDEEYTGNGAAENGYHILDCEAVLEKQEDGYRFLSNRMVTEADQIADQTFPITLPEIGDAVLAAYAPGSGMSPQSDVTFMVLWPDGRMLQTLTGPCDNNLRAAAESFESVEAVSFPDYNGDGFDDLITIASYSYVQGPDAGGGFYETRIYSGNTYGYLNYERELSRYVNETLDQPTIAAVTGLLSESFFYGDWRIASCAGTSEVCAMSQEEIDGWIGTVISFQGDCYLWTRGDESGLYEETWVNGYSLQKVRAQDVQEGYRVTPDSLGIGAEEFLEIQTVEFGGTLVSPGFFLLDQKTLLAVRDGVFFTAVREE